MKSIIHWTMALAMAAAAFSIAPTTARAADSVVAMKAYKAALHNKAAFYSIDDKKTYTLNELKDANGDPLKADRFAVVDMDSDGMPEVVLDFGGPYHDVVILHYEGGKLYGFSTAYTYYLANDGSYNGSLQAWSFTYCKITSIAKNTYTLETLARTEADPNKEGDTPRYYINESEVTKEKHDAVVQRLLANRQENEALWHDCTDENIATIFP